MNFKKFRKSFSRQLMYIAIGFIISGLITYAFAGKYLFTNFNTTYKNLLYGFCIGITLWKGNQFMAWISSKYFPWPQNPILTLFVSSVSSLAFTVIDIFAVNYFYMKFVFNVNILDNLSRWIPQMVIILLISVLITLSFYLVYFFKWWRIAAVNEEKLKQEAIQLRYDALKSQVNPHFLFNSLSVLSSLVETDTAKAKLFIQQFSDIYRYVLDQKDKELVTLDDEVTFAQSFINLHQIRHGESLKITLDIKDLSGYIVPLSLQTFLENCFKHNIISEENPLFIKLWRDGNYVIIQNSVQKKRAIQDSTGIGLETIRKRYEYLSQLPMEVVEDDKHFTVKIPIVKSIS